LHVACEEGDVEVVRLLLEHGANVNQKNNEVIEYQYNHNMMITIIIIIIIRMDIHHCMLLLSMVILKL